MNISPSLTYCQAVFSHKSIYPKAKSGLTTHVDIKQIRRKNMLALIGNGKRAEFARKVGTDPAYISQILSTKTKADIGDSLARMIEAAFGLPHGWMDREHGPTEQRFPEELVAAWEYLLPAERAEFVEEINRRAAHNKAAAQMLAPKLVKEIKKQA